MMEPSRHDSADDSQPRHPQSSYRAVNEGTAGQGGYFVPPEHLPRLFDYLASGGQPQAVRMP
jgi:hypothetical protein